MEQKSQKAENMKQKIILCAYELFKKNGFESTHVHEIVEAAGCAKGTFYLYFETKIALLYELADGIFRSFANAIFTELADMNENPFDQIEKMFNAIACHMTENIGALRMIHDYEMLNLIQQKKLDATFVNGLIDVIDNFLKKGIEKDYFRPLNTDVYSKILFSLGHDMLESSILTNFPADMYIVKDELMVIIRKILIKDSHEIIYTK